MSSCNPAKPNTQVYNTCQKENIFCWTTELNFKTGSICPVPAPTKSIPGLITDNYSGIVPVALSGSPCLSLYNGDYTPGTAVSLHYAAERGNTTPLPDDKIYGTNPENFMVFDSSQPSTTQPGKTRFFSSPANPQLCQFPATVQIINRDPGPQGLPVNYVDYALLSPAQAVCDKYDQTCGIDINRLVYTVDDVNTGLVDAKTAAQVNQRNIADVIRTGLQPNQPYVLDTNLTVRDKLLSMYCPMITPDQSLCPSNPVTGKKDTNCSNFQTDPECHTWINDFINTANKNTEAQNRIFDDAVNRVCQGKNPDEFTECACVSFNQTSAYKDLLQLEDKLGIPPFPVAKLGCWFNPCAVAITQGSEVFFLPNSDTAVAAATCPDICTQVNIIKDNAGSQIDITQNLTCKGGGGGGGGFWQKYKWWIIGGVIAFIIIAFIIVIAVLAK